jgi:aminopeptidase N
LHTYHWRLRDPIPVYLANFALGPFSGTSTTYTSMNGTLPVDIVTTQNASRIPGTMVNLPQALSIFENRFGPYQWERLGYVFTHLPGFALENATNILMPLVTLTGNLFYESVVVHELAHAWFGNLVTCLQPSEMWFNEGTARWSESLFFEDRYNLSTAVNHLRAAHQKALNASDIEDGGFFSLSDVPSDHIYGTASYEKGATVVQTLRHYVGDDAFFPALQALFQSSYQFDNISSNQFADFLGTHSGQDLTSFFDGWVHSPGWVSFSLDSVVTTPQGAAFEARLHLRQTRYFKPNFINDNKLEVAFYDADHTRFLDTLTFSGETGTYTTTIPFQPSMVVLDPSDKCLDASFDNLVKVKNTGTSNFTFAGASILVTALEDSAMFYVSHRYGRPTGLLNYDTLVLADNYYEFQRILPGTATTYRLNLEFRGNASQDGKDRRWFGNAAESAVRLVYRPHAGANWEPVTNVLRSTGGPFDLRGTLSVPDNPPAGQYAFALRVQGVSRQQARLQNDWLQLGPVPATHTLTVQWTQPQLASLQVLDMQGRAVKTPQPVQGQQAQLAVEGLPTGVYLLQALDKRGKPVSVKRFVVQH